MYYFSDFNEVQPSSRNSPPDRFPKNRKNLAPFLYASESWHITFNMHATQTYKSNCRVLCRALICFKIYFRATAYQFLLWPPKVAAQNHRVWIKIQVCLHNVWVNRLFKHYLQAWSSSGIRASEPKCTCFAMTRCTNLFCSSQCSLSCVFLKQWIPRLILNKILLFQTRTSIQVIRAYHTGNCLDFLS